MNSIHVFSRTFLDHTQVSDAGAGAVVTKLQNGKKKKFDFSRLAQSATEPDEDDDVTSGRKSDKSLTTSKDAVVTSHMYGASFNYRYYFRTVKFSPLLFAWFLLWLPK